MALLTLAEAKLQLDIETTAQDTELQAYVDALTDVVERYTGPVITREVTDTVEGNGTTLCLTRTPAVALVSVTPALPAGSALDLGTVLLHGRTGIVRCRSGGTFGRGLWDVVYTVGRGATVPPTINLAARILLQHLWRTQHGAARGGGGADDYAVTEPIVGFGYAVPNRVLELLEPYRLPPEVG
ncbi:head-tail connector protein [Streptomyces sp. NPDC005953]|uniref:head-tail connector protein n=1 Tax=Streptomyces sp. NPDC005953 TaxID=3156719 RepID=UPI0033D0B72D